MTESRFVGDDALADVPAPPAGHAAVLVMFTFTSLVTLHWGGMMTGQRPNHDVWIPSPVLTIDGVKREASWSGWWYPVAPGRHELAVTSPAPARRRIQLRAGQVQVLRYRASIAIRKDRKGERVLRWDCNGLLTVARQKSA
jgi:hypothetical protein